MAHIDRNIDSSPHRHDNVNRYQDCTKFDKSANGHYQRVFSDVYQEHIFIHGYHEHILNHVHQHEAAHHEHIVIVKDHPSCSLHLHQMDPLHLHQMDNSLQMVNSLHQHQNRLPYPDVGPGLRLPLRQPNLE